MRAFSFLKLEQFIFRFILVVFLFLFCFFSPNSTRVSTMFQQPIKNFKIDFNALNERGTICSGDLLTGHISFELTKATQITSITTTLSGRAKVHLHGGGEKTMKNYAKLDIFIVKSVILLENGATQNPTGPPGTTKLQPGTHVYPFTCQIPQGDFPSAFRGEYGQIMYNMTVDISRLWHLSKSFVTKLNFVNRIDTNQPELSAPLAGSNTISQRCLYWASGPTTVTARTEKKAFVPGETVKIFCDISNGSSRTATPKVILHQKQIYYNQDKAQKVKESKRLAKVTGEPVGAHTSDVHAEITLDIPSSAALTISNCSIINVYYLIEVTLRGKRSPDVTVLFPIILCDTPVSAQAPPYS